MAVCNLAPLLRASRRLFPNFIHLFTDWSIFDVREIINGQNANSFEMGFIRELRDMEAAL